MSRRVLVVVNDAAAGAPPEFADTFRDDRVTVSDRLPADADRHDLAILWNYRQIVAGAGDLRNLVVFHASALPEDRGMAPIYHTVARGRPNVTISAMRPVDAIDEGDLVARASFPNRPDYTAPILRRWIARISVDIAGMLARDARIRRMRGRPQRGVASVNGRRRPAESRIDPGVPLAAVMPHLRACEPAHPAFVEMDGVRWIVEVRPANEPPFPQVEVEYYD